MDGTIEGDASRSKRAVTPSGAHALLVFEHSFAIPFKIKMWLSWTRYTPTADYLHLSF